MKYILLICVLIFNCTNAQIKDSPERQITLLVKIIPSWDEPKDYHIYFLIGHVVFAEIVRDYDRKMFGEKVKLIFSRNQIPINSVASKFLVKVMWPSNFQFSDTLFKQDVSLIKQKNYQFSVISIQPYLE